ncbi:hypothetical protein ABKV19_014532 [Rosa sericea]
MTGNFPLHASQYHRRSWSSIGSAALTNGSSARLNFDTCYTKLISVKALNLIFGQWGIEANMKQSNITGEPCSGAASDSAAFDNGDYNPFIKCDSSVI